MAAGRLFSAGASAFANGSFTGAVKTLSINAKTTIKPADKASDKAPDYCIFANGERGLCGGCRNAEWRWVRADVLPVSGSPCST
jgi:uncharacterized protein (DUF736 family)